MRDVKLVTVDDLDGKSIVVQDGKLSAQLPPIVYNVQFDAPSSSITVPTGATGAVLFLVRTAPGTLRIINGGVQGQLIYVRYTNAMQIASTNSIRLINATAPTTALDRNKVSAFLCLAPGVWTELFRNFT